MTLAAMDRGKACIASSGHSSTATRPKHSEQRRHPNQHHLLQHLARCQPNHLASSPAGPATLAALFHAPSYVSMENVPPSHRPLAAGRPPYRCCRCRCCQCCLRPALLHGRKTQQQQPGRAAVVQVCWRPALGLSCLALAGCLTTQRRVG